MKNNPEPVLPNKKLGQHWIKDLIVLEQIVKYANLKESDYVLEIGPGQGSLTEVLLKQNIFLTVVEIDRQLASQLRKQFASHDNFLLIEGDILKLNLSSIPKDYKIVANIPYYLTSHLLRILTESTNSPELAVMLVQKEVASRISAEPGDMSTLSVIVQMYYETSLGVVVPSKMFTPPPKVDSQVLILHRRPKALFEGLVDKEQLFRVIKAGFSERRKKLRSSLSGGLHLTKDEVSQWLKSVDINPDLRAQNLSLEEWLKLAAKQ